MSIAEVMRLTWVQVEQLYLVPMAIQNKMESDAMKGQGAVSKESYIGAYLDLKPEATYEQAEAAWLKDQRGM